MSTNQTPPFIGSFVLETLTTGMYGQSENALREYVQNAFDAVRSATRRGVLAAGEGRIDVTLTDNDSLVIKDNGLGIAAAAAWGTLTSIGASKKDRKRDAGFRGIGRLAGIAFCDTLTFCTKSADEEVETSVIFDCQALRDGMNSESGGGLRLTELLTKAVSIKVAKKKPIGEHYMSVTLAGLEGAPDSFRDADAIRDYLAETSPVDYDPKWKGSKAVLQKAKAAGWSIESVRLYVSGPELPSVAVYKEYQDSYALKGGKNPPLADIKSFGGASERWWGWVGLTGVPGMITDDRVHGIRVRVKNIQVDGTTIFDELFSDVNNSYARFNTWYVGEVHIDPSLLIPNARRDGFEDSSEWTDLKVTLADEICSPLAKRAYAASRDKQKSVETIDGKVASLVQKAGRVAPGNADDRYKLLSDVAKIRLTISSALEDAVPDVQLQLKAQLDRLELVKQHLSPPTQLDRASIRKELIDEILEQINELLESELDPEVFSKVKRLLRRKIV
jgi:molecular chaperone HtpG